MIFSDANMCLPWKGSKWCYSSTDDSLLNGILRCPWNSTFQLILKCSISEQNKNNNNIISNFKNLDSHNKSGLNLNPYHSIVVVHAASQHVVFYCWCCWCHQLCFNFCHIKSHGQIHIKVIRFDGCIEPHC